jgi:hypothetical protein
LSSPPSRPGGTLSSRSTRWPGGPSSWTSATESRNPLREPQLPWRI